MTMYSATQILQKNVGFCENHSTLSHLFIHPCCSFQTLAKKIISLFASTITLGIPIAINFLYITISKKRMLSLSASIKSTEGFPPIDEQALQFVKQSLLERPTIASTYIGGSRGLYYYQPTNQAIPKLTSLLFLYENELKKIINKEKDLSAENLWNNKKVQKAADSYMKTAYVVSMLTLHDMPAFTKYLSRKDIKRTNYEALIKQDSYAFRTFFYCSIVYHLIREGFLFPVNKNENSSLYTQAQKFSISTEERPGFDSEKTPNTYLEHANKFYQGETTQRKWNSLYNNFCQAVNPTVINGRDTRFEKWSKKDLSETSFLPIPDTLPT